MSAEEVSGRVGPQTMIPELLQRWPQARAVLDRYGLHGCGGASGPAETLDFFARAHDVSLKQLLKEIRASLLEPLADAPVIAPESSLADTIYRPFFKAGIALVLTLGAAWGAFLLLRIAFFGAFTSVGVHEVNAHGHAQIFGWVGLFVMGFAYQAFPRFKHTHLSHPRLALATLIMMVIGILGRSGSQAFLALVPWLTVMGVAASLLEVAAIGLFAGIIWRTLRGAEKPLVIHDAYILCALGWFFVQAVYGTIYFAATALAPTAEALVQLVATWQAPLRDIQIHGFILLMILGVSHRIFHPFYGLPAPKPRVSAGVLVGINLGVIGEVVGLVLMRTQGYQWASLWYGSVLLIAVSAVVLVAGWKLYHPAIDADRSLKFMRTAYVWLFISLAMLVALPLYQFVLLPALAPTSHAVEIGFSHAYYGAIRHAITVGFVSLMIMGVAAKVVPTLGGIDLRTLPRLWLPFALINTGCAMRVGFQTMTDFSEMAFPVAGVSGLLEVTALALWGVHLWRLMRSGAGELTPLAAGEAIAAHHTVAQIIGAYPQALPVLIGMGFTPLRNPVLRNTLARTVTLARAAHIQGMAAEELVNQLNAACTGGAPALRGPATATA